MILLDTHVHIHDCCTFGAFLDGALDNFTKAANQHSRHREDDFTGVLMLTEIAGVNRFSDIANCTDEQGGWSISPTDEACSLIARNAQDRALIIVAGQQIVTQEKLEVLALGTTERVSDGKEIESVIDLVQAAGAIAILPWGFGKWMGRRGAVVDSLIEGSANAGFFLGDNSGRPKFMKNVKQFSRGAEKNIRILPGSDPLPFPSECNRAGCYGFAIHEGLDFSKPAADIKRMLRNSNLGIEPYGTLETPLRFFRNQLAMQWHKRSR